MTTDPLHGPPATTIVRMHAFALAVRRAAAGLCEALRIPALVDRLSGRPTDDR